MLQESVTSTHISFADLSDDRLLAEVRRLAAAEHRATAALIRSLMELDSRRLYLGEGCSSLFTYCTQVLHFAEGAAYNRIEAARAARRFPLIIAALEDGSLTLTAVRLLAPHLTMENHAAVLSAATHKSKRQIEELVCSLRPQPDAAVIVRRLPASPLEPVGSLVSAASAPPENPAVLEVPSVGTATGEDSPRPRDLPARIVPIAPERYRMQLTVSRETHDRFRRAQALLRHAVPSGDAAEIVDRALALLVERLERQRFAETARPRAAKPSANCSRQVPAAVRRAVWRRDAGRCAFVGGHGRCTETACLEFHHVEPYAAGGEATVQNLELRCRAHNAYEARLFFGDDVVREEQACWG